MTSKRWRKKGVTPFGVVLVVVGAFLAVRSSSAVRTVLALPAPRTAAVTTVRDPALVRAQQRDATLTQVRVPARDPFVLPARPAAQTPHPAPPVHPPVKPPQLRLIHFDQVSPEVVLEVEGVMSGRLQAGQSFQGWVVVSITPGAVVVAKDGNRITLTSARR